MPSGGLDHGGVRRASVASVIETRRLEPADRERWEELFRAYISFYERELDQTAYDRAWREFASDAKLHALGAWLDGRLVGITHFLVHPSTSEPDLCYLEDLFTDPEVRGRGVARALIEAVREWAREHGCGSVYWQTHETNVVARRLYDDVARDEGYIVYTLPV
ncbi:ribosomal protein S18 acetylase RimI-like enzyme [Humibacillus xanthopallidus]|uniref:Ribosomal protein S18 acetylase RimI-like enzyme n=1 Tax=Humibacillus xanthopallidus TaxID=412689 RepID=A0A543PMK8_9MICO|nr:ribosomal protein S18 acetylase RimI-like enzyme [Humibacillus xanthopallidus]